MKRERLIILLILCHLLLLGGCAGHFLNALPVSDNESRMVTTAFYEMLARHNGCNCCFDAEANVTLSVSWLFGGRSVMHTGYLQAMRPSFFKFVGINPFGQPQFVLVTDGKRFGSVLVSAAKGYEGKVRSNTFLKYLPPGFSPEAMYYWLTGTLGPGRVVIQSVMREKDRPSYWLKVSPGLRTETDWLLYDSDENIIQRHILQDSQGKVLVDVSYEDYQKNGGGCPLPGKITVASPSQNGSIELVLHDLVSDVAFSERDFDYVLPVGFEKVFVE